jgi:hypothetical protein
VPKKEGLAQVLYHTSGTPVFIYYTWTSSTQLFDAEYYVVGLMRLSVCTCTCPAHAHWT